MVKNEREKTPINTYDGELDQLNKMYIDLENKADEQHEYELENGTKNMALEDEIFILELDIKKFKKLISRT